MCAIAWDQVAQMLTALAAVAALIIGPRLSFNSSRRLAIAQSRQVWLDAIRTDTAELIALHQEIVVTRYKAKLEDKPEKIDTDSAKMTRISVLMAQIRLRLNMDKDHHATFMKSIGTFVSNYDKDTPAYNQNPILKALDPITRDVWDAIKAGKL